MKKLGLLFLTAIFAVTISGCAMNFYKGKPEQEKKIRQLTGQIEELEQAKRLLEDKLAGEISGNQVLLEKTSRGLIITMTNDVLFDSGKAKLKKSAHPVLNKIAGVLQESVPNRDIGVEGHTDNVPIKHSGWKSNWELSAARATSVLHYLIDNCGIQPKRLSAIGYGEFRPIESNETKAGKARNRRVEIIILPKDITKKSYEETQGRISEEAKQAEESKIGQETVK
ncbi:MAG: OmpA family protein [Candidatus Omnitrophota bacterium]|nr:OmpA family protein [Candidatus Omnitrophota bacterium]